MKRIIINLSIALAIFAAFATYSCSKNEKQANNLKKTVKISTISKTVIAIGYGEDFEKAISEAKNDAEFRAFGTFTHNGKNLELQNHGKCKEYNVVEKFKDDVGLWTVKIKAVVEKI